MVKDKSEVGKEETESPRGKQPSQSEQQTQLCFEVTVMR